MKLNDSVSTYLFNNGDSIFRDGTTLKEIEGVLTGLNQALEGQVTKMVEDTTFLKSYVTKQVTQGTKSREDNLIAEFGKTKGDLEKQIETLKSSNTTLKANTPLSADPAELRKQALDEVDPDKRERLIDKADLIEMKNQLAERAAHEEKLEAENLKASLVNIAQAEWGDRKLPKTLKENLQWFIGSDEETTKGKINNFGTEWDDFTKDMRTAGVETATPPGSGEPERDPEEAMREKMSKMDF